MWNSIGLALSKKQLARAAVSVSTALIDALAIYLSISLDSTIISALEDYT